MHSVSTLHLNGGSLYPFLGLPFLHVPLSPLEIHEGEAQDLNHILAFVDHLISERAETMYLGENETMGQILEAEKGDTYCYALSRKTRTRLVVLSYELC